MLFDYAYIIICNPAQLTLITIFLSPVFLNSPLGNYDIYFMERDFIHIVDRQGYGLAFNEFMHLADKSRFGLRSQEKYLRDYIKEFDYWAKNNNVDPTLKDTVLKHTYFKGMT